MLHVASIGVGGMGGNTMKSVASHPKVKIVALCDVDARTLETAAKSYPDAATYKDWRDMLANHADKFDAVTVGTPDHMHAAPAVTALRAKKHLYLQKPMASTLHECRVITQEAAKAGVMTQLGNQGRSSVESRMAVQLIRSGVIGKIKEVILWENKPLSWWPKNTELRAQADPIPAGLDWDLWLGVREPRPYLADTYHPKTWRAWFDFGVGEMGDMGCHHFDTSFDALKLTAPIRVRQTTPGSSGPLWGTSESSNLSSPAATSLPAKPCNSRGMTAACSPTSARSRFPRASINSRLPALTGSASRALFSRSTATTSPSLFPKSVSRPSAIRLDIPLQDHYHDWVNAILEGHKSCDDFTHGGPLTESVLVGAMSDRVAGEWLDWDAKQLKFTNNANANSLVRRDYRKGWQIEGLG